jgi:hypothetical protein
LRRQTSNLPIILGRNHRLSFYGEVHRNCVEGRGTEWEKALSKTLLDRDAQIEVIDDLPIEPLLEALFVPIRVAWAAHKKLWVSCHKKNSKKIIIFSTRVIRTPTIQL